jgi:hypothetical protein
MTAGPDACATKAWCGRAMESVAMFQTVDEQIESTEGGRPTISARLVRFASIAVVLVLFFAGLYFAIVSFE